MRINKIILMPQTTIKTKQQDYKNSFEQSKMPPTKPDPIIFNGLLDRNVNNEEFEIYICC